MLVDAQRLGQDLVDRHARIEGRERVLEDELHGAPIGLEVVALEREHVARPGAVVEQDAAGVGLRARA